MNLEGKVALITGGGRGIGVAIAKRFLSDGAKICITGRNQDTLDAAAAAMAAKDRVVTCAGDVSQLDDVQKMVETTVDFGGKLDVLVNNAGIDPAGSVTDLDPALWQKVMDINLTGPFFTMKTAIPKMMEAGGGSIINISSLGGLRCLPGMPAYAASKAGLIMLTKQAALDYGPHKIRCNVVCPGATRTQMLENSLGPLAETLKTDVNGVFAHISSTVPLRRAAAPEEITGACSYLASDDSSFMTASVLLLDGGASVVDVSGATLSMSGINWGVD
ncbi:MAG: SDR family oxidoreductase [Desulfobacteraceae bacterium]|jgi:NAD(P)-dependent dehydrogenase (short-subunit alcohol dehydrogenase family)